MTIGKHKNSISWQRRLLGVAENASSVVRVSQNTLYAFYDLSVSPVTFDIILFLIRADMERQQLGYEFVHVCIVNKEDQLTPDQQWRLHNILMSAGWLLPTCYGITLFTSRREALIFKARVSKYIFPAGYTVNFPIKYRKDITAAVERGLPVSSLRANVSAKHWVKRWLTQHAPGKKVVVVTLRECGYQQDRNSALLEWAAFVRQLDRVVYVPVIVRDIEKVFEPVPDAFGDVLVFPEAVWNLELRMALYEQSCVNLMVNSGPASLCMFNSKVRFLIFKMITATSPVATPAHLKSTGFEPGKQLPFAQPWQRLVWQDDTVEVIKEMFTTFIADTKSFS